MVSGQNVCMYVCTRGIFLNLALDLTSEYFLELQKVFVYFEHFLDSTKCGKKVFKTAEEGRC